MATKSGKPGDPIDAAIDAVEAQPIVGNLVEVPTLISSTGRLVVLSVPDDLADGEVIELAAFVLVGLRRHVDAHRPAARIWTPAT